MGVPVKKKSFETRNGGYKKKNQESYA